MSDAHPHLQDGSAGGSDSVHRVVPHSIESERAVLSSMLQDERCITAAAAGGVFPELFYSEGRQILFKLLLELHDSGQPTGPVNLTDVLRDRKQLDIVGGPAELAGTMHFVASAADYDYYLEKLREKWILRQVIDRSNLAIAGAYDDCPDVGKYLDDCETKLLAIRDAMEAGEDSFQSTAAEVLLNVMDDLQNDEAKPALPTGFRDVDAKLGGLAKAGMSVFAGRPGMGKTAFALGIVERVAIENRQAVAVFTLEMSREQLMTRMLSSRSKVALNTLLKKPGSPFKDSDYPKIQRAATDIAGATITIDETPGMTVNQLRAKARRLHKAGKADLIVVDYLQLMKATGPKSQNREQEVASISRGITQLSKELKIPIIVLAQINREFAKRKTHVPIMSDLRESGAIEQDAALIGFIHRPIEFEEDEDKKEELRGQAQLIIAKDRFGATGLVRLTYLDDYTRFEDRAYLDRLV